MGEGTATRMQAPKLDEAHDWFDDQIVPKRTAAAGFSGNRLWKSPRGWVKGNSEDPNGLCGDAASYVYEQFWNDFGDYTTSDGHHMGLILWEGRLLNHIANVMLVKNKVSVQQYQMAGKKLTLVSGKQQYTDLELYALHVYDLYYKKRTTVKAWWRDRDGSLGGTIKLGLMHSIQD